MTRETPASTTEAVTLNCPDHGAQTLPGRGVVAVIPAGGSPWFQADCWQLGCTRLATAGTGRVEAAVHGVLGGKVIDARTGERLAAMPVRISGRTGNREGTVLAVVALALAAVVVLAAVVTGIWP